MQPVIKFWKILFTGLILTFALALPAFPFQSSSRLDSGITQIQFKRLYEIRFMQISIPDLSEPILPDSSIRREIESLKKEAQELAHNHQFEFALLVLDEIDDLISINSGSIPTIPADESTPQTSWEPKIVLGLDSWQQKFQLVYEETDTVLSENSMNPFAGVQLDFSYQKNQKLSITSSTLLKQSRDYFAATENFRMNRSFNGSSELELSNYFDWNHFTQADYVSYFQNKLTGEISLQPIPRLQFKFSDELRYKQYQTQEFYYASFLQNELKLAADANFKLRHRTGLAFRFQQRRHSDFSEKDFNRSFINFSGEFSLPFQASLRIFNDLSQKKYFTQDMDSLYQSNYCENWLVSSLRIPVTRLISMEFNDNLTFRDYENEFSYLRDNFENEIEGNLQFHFTPNLTFRAGYYYGVNIHRPGDNPEDISAQVEDYFTHGPTFSLDYFLGQRLLLNITNSSQNRIFPNSQNIDNLALYSDRNLKSLFLFLTWEINAFWQLNILSNYDTDRDLENDTSDSRSTLFSFEISRRF